MKKIVFLMIFVSVAFLAQATILHVDINANRPAGYYSSLPAAINAASVGDTLFIYPSNVSYGNVTLTKRLHLFGFGFNGATNGVSHISTITMDTTTTPNSSPSGSSIYGLTIDYFNTSKANINNIVLAGNYFRYGQIQVSTNSYGWHIKNNLIATSIDVNNATNVLISNNIFDNAYGIYYSNSSTVTILNNIFFNWYYFYNVFNATVSNNIFLCVTNPNQNQMANNVFTNNLSYRSASEQFNLPPTGNTGTGNLSNQNPLFVNGTTSGSFDYTKDYHLTASSPAKNAGTDGTDIGPYGGTNPFVWGGAITIPQITEMVITNPVVNQGTNITVKVKAKKADL
ncbi:MAG: hypothetical protein JXR34_02005 [Bacteroidales bacterium]|nr:hypothetical protein [Bacteroidales bacterium]